MTMQPMFQRNGAPRGFGQQRGDSLFLAAPTAPDLREKRLTHQALASDTPGAPPQAGADGSMRNAYRALFRDLPQQGMSQLFTAPDAPPPAAARPSGTTPGGSTTRYQDANAPPATAAQAPSGTGGTGGGGNRYQGFDFDQAASSRDITKSAKYSFADATRQAGEAGHAMPRTKDEAATYFATHIQPKLEASGFPVLEIAGEKARIVTAEDRAAGNTEGSWVDWLVNADSDDAEIAWQVESGTGAQGSPQAAAPAAQTASDPRTTQQLMAALQSPDAANGSINIAALLEQLQASFR
jgi:hypothetical protein